MSDPTRKIGNRTYIDLGYHLSEMRRAKKIGFQAGAKAVHDRVLDSLRERQRGQENAYSAAREEDNPSGMATHQNMHLGLMAAVEDVQEAYSDLCKEDK